MVQKFHEMFENVQLAKSILKKNNISLDDEAYQTIRGMLEKTPGWVGLFTKFHYEGGVKVDDLAVLYDQLNAARGILNQLPKAVDAYATMEELTDALEVLSTQQKGKKFYNELTSSQRQQLPKDEYTRTRMEQLSITFFTLPGEVRTNFLKKLRQFTGLNVLDGLESFLDAHTSGFYMEKILADVAQVANADVVFQDDERGYLIVELKSFEASRILNAATQWCLRLGNNYWQSYVGYDKLTRQYSLYNFNVKLSDIHSMLGMTINRVGRIVSAHWKNDGAVDAPGIARYFGDDSELFKPHLKGLSDEEVESRQAFITALKHIRDFDHLESSALATPEQRSLFVKSYDFLRTHKRGMVDVYQTLFAAVYFDDPELLTTIIEQMTPELTDENFNFKEYRFNTRALMSRALDCNSNRLISFLLEKGCLFASFDASKAARYYSATRQYAQIPPLLDIAEKHSYDEREEVVKILYATNDPATYITLLQKDPTYYTLDAAGKLYFELGQRSPELLAAMEASATSVQKPEYLLWAVGKYSTDEKGELFQRLYDAVPEEEKLVDSMHGGIASELLRLGRKQDAENVIGGMRKTLHTYEFNNYAKGVVRILNNKDNVLGTTFMLGISALSLTTLLTDMGYDLDDEDIQQWATRVVDAVNRGGAHLRQEDLHEISAHAMQQGETCMKVVAKMLLPLRHNADFIHQNVEAYDILSFQAGLDQTSLLHTLGEMPKNDYVPEENAIACYYDDFSDYQIRNFYDDGNAPEEDEFEANIDEDSYDYNDLWYYLSAEHHAMLVKILRTRGWDVSNPNEVIGVLDKFQNEDEGDYDDYDDEDDEDDEDDDDEKGGKPCYDLVDALKQATIDTYAQDTQDASWNARIAPLTDEVFDMRGGKFYHDIKGVEKLVLLLPVAYLKDNLTWDIINEMCVYQGEAFTASDLVRAILTAKDGLFKPDTESDDTASKDTFQEFATHALREIAGGEGIALD